MGAPRLTAEYVQRRARQALAAELRGVRALRPLFASRAWFATVERLAACRGRVLVSGLGKSGLIGRRIAASLRSTGTPALFIHPVEATHGDLGIVDGGDVALLISKSGGNREVCRLLPLLRGFGVSLIAITAVADSPLARGADICLCLRGAEEIAPFAAVPTVSTTQVQVIGDALTVLLSELKGFTSEAFALLHPGGELGRQLALRVADVMHRAEALPIVSEETPLADALLVIMEKRLGMTTVVDPAGRLSGVLTDGDFKRILVEHGGDIRGVIVRDVASREPRTIEPEAQLATALARMERNRPAAITSLVVTDEERRPAGVVHIHDILRGPLGGGD